MNKKVRSLSVRFSEEDLRAINSISKKLGMWASTWVRQVVSDELVRLGKKKDIKNYMREYGR
jgi:hypothetical protein